MLNSFFTPAWISAAILKEPLIHAGRVSRGAIILNHVDNVVELLPELAQYFIIIERLGFCGITHSAVAEIKFVEDRSTLEETKVLFPRAELLEFSSADFVDSTIFRPLEIAPEFDVIQISCWSPRKRVELFIETAARAQHLTFVHLGHFEQGGTQEELEYRDKCVRLVQTSGARVSFPLAGRDSNDDLPWDKAVINQWINKARIGVLTATPEGRNRFKMECLAADRPFLVATDAGAATQEHINAKTGALFEPNVRDLQNAITTTLERRADFAPREYLLEHSGRVNSLRKLREALRAVCSKTGDAFRFEDIEWDGRNEGFTWGEVAFSSLRERLHQYREAMKG